MSGHAKLSPSSAYRWFACPGSVRLSEQFPDESNEYAREGTAAHTLAERCLRTGAVAADFLGSHEGRIRVDYRTSDGADAAQVFEVTPEMVSAVQVYLDHCRSVEAGPPRGQMLVEERVHLGRIDTSLSSVWGTADCIIYVPDTQVLHVIDLKYGRGKVVSATDNLQLKLYALAAWGTFHERFKVARVITTIVQPRAGEEPVRKAEYTAAELLDFVQDVADAIARVERQEAEFVPGGHCDFCRAKAVCPSLSGKALAVAQDEFALADPATLSIEQCVRLLEKAEMLDTWIRGVREYLHELATKGTPVPGYKLVPKRAARQWAVPEDVAAKALLDLGVLADDVYRRELVSPAQAEKLVGKKRFPADLVAWVSGGYNLVKDVDPRPAVTMHPGDDFVALPNNV